MYSRIRGSLSVGDEDIARRYNSEQVQGDTLDDSTQKERIDGFVSRALDLEDEIELVETVHSGRNTIKVFIFRPGGVTIEDCTRINRRLRRELEHDEEISATLGIEVSSPGLDRRLHSRRDFERVIGEHVRLELTEEVDGRRVITALLTDVTDEDDLLLEPSAEKKSGPEREKSPFRVSLNLIREGRIEVIF